MCHESQSYVRHALCVMTFIDMWGMTHCTCDDDTDSIICIRGMTYSTCGGAHSNVEDDSLASLLSYDVVCPDTHSRQLTRFNYGVTDSFMCVIRLVHLREMIRTYV